MIQVWNLERLHGALDAHRALVADAAHELRMPLTALKLQLQLQLAELSVREGPRTAAFAKVHERLDRTTRLVAQLLTLARLEPGCSTQPHLQVDLAGLVRSVAGDFAALARERGLTLAITAEPSVLGDAESLRILLYNLVDHALRLTPAAGEVPISCGIDSGDPVPEVAGTGPGIPIAARERVFCRSYRHLGPERSGSGLGLAIVRRIAEDHGALVSLGDPPSGTGLVVRVRFHAA